VLSVFATGAPLEVDACAPAPARPARVAVVAGPEAVPAAQRAAEVLNADGHLVLVTPMDRLEGLADVDGVLVLGGLVLERAARAAAPAHAYVRAELLEGAAAGWDRLVLAAARETAIAVAPPRLGMCG
jgi:hypothetical protein